MATIEIDGKEYQVDNGRMIIEVTDELGIPIPRFCYHKKLSIAANCRMCLVQVEKSRKPLPACATPITDGMKIFTQSEETKRSQEAVMEFLLINHPLDCPICDQGGECELQDVSLEFGAGDSDYDEAKRSVADDNLGSLISTEMTRCIHCTRCVRFGDEIAGMRELGACGRGEHMQIGTYVQHAMRSEVSGNIIDLCPVGALTSKPYRFTARAWEMSQFPHIAPHDCLGSHVNVHVRRQTVMRVVPREQEQLNEVWLSDRDRFGYTGLNHADRAQFPRIKRAGKWQTVDWSTALNRAAVLMGQCLEKHGASQFGAFSSPSASLEEQYLLQRWMRALGVQNLDHRLQQSDFRDQDHLPLMPVSTLPYAALDQQSTIVLIGTHLHREVPLAGVRVRKATLAGAKVFAVNPVDYAFPFEVADRMIVSPTEMTTALGKILLALVGGVVDFLPVSVQGWLKTLTIDPQATAIAAAIKAERAVLVTGALVENHPDAATIRTLLHLIIEQAAGVQHLRLTVGSNAAGAWVAGMVPHRTVGGQPVSTPGLDVQAAMARSLKGYCLLGVEALDFANPQAARAALADAECVIALSAFEDEALEAYADVILPIGLFTETSGTYINVDGTWQQTTGCSKLPGEARPAWKVLRVLANLTHCDGFQYESSDEVREEIAAQLGESALSYQPWPLELSDKQTTGLTRIGEWPIYGGDALVRRAAPLQHAASADQPCARMHPETAEAMRLTTDAFVQVSQGNQSLTLPLQIDARIAKGAVWVLNGLPDTAVLGASFAEIVCEKGDSC